MAALRESEWTVTQISSAHAAASVMTPTPPAGQTARITLIHVSIAGGTTANATAEWAIAPVGEGGSLVGILPSSGGNATLEFPGGLIVPSGQATLTVADGGAGAISAFSISGYFS